MDNGNFVLSNTKNIRSSIKNWLIISSFCLAFTIITFGYIQFNLFKSLIYFKRQKNSLTKKINKQLPLVNKQSILQNQNKNINQFVSQYLYMEAFPDKEIEIIAQHLPQEMCLDSLSFKSKCVHLSGKSKNTSAITTFINRLSQINKWNKIELLQLKKIDEYTYFFEIKAK